MSSKVHKLPALDISASDLSSERLAVNYVSSGVVCHALLYLHRRGFLDLLNNQKYLEKNEIEISIEDQKDQLMVNTALTELEINGIFQRTDERYYLTPFGKELTNYIGLMYYIYDGYSALFSNFFNNNSKENRSSNLINDEAVVIGSDDLAKKFINPFIIRHILNLDFSSGLICDLGCGDASRLQLLSKILDTGAIGIDISDDAIKIAKKLLRNDKHIQIVKDDVTDLKNVYPDVTLLMQTMVMHDFTPTDYCAEIMSSYINNFPNMKYFFFCDIVAPSGNMKSLLPGFDYIHAMLGIKTRTYSETIEMFSSANYEIVSENPIDNLPNTFLWILKPKK